MIPESNDEIWEIEKDYDIASRRLMKATMRAP